MISSLTAMRRTNPRATRYRWSYLLVEELRRIVSEPRADARGALSPHLLQCAHLEYRRSPAQPCLHFSRSELEALASLRSDPAAISAMAGNLAVMFLTS